MKKVYNELDRETAFYYYFQLGDSRTLNKIKKKTDIPLVVLSEWARKYDWENKIKEQEGIIVDANDERKVSTLAALSTASIYTLYMGIINNPKSTVADKLKAADRLEKLRDKAAELKDFRRVAVHIKGLEDLKRRMIDAGLPVREDIE